MLKAILIDDELIALKSLQLLLESYENIVIAGCYLDPLQAIREASMIEPDIIFIDIEMEEMSGIYVAEQLSLIMTKEPAIVFVTAYNEYAVDAFEINAIDYILKPVSPKRFAETISRIEKEFQQRSRTKEFNHNFVLHEIATNTKKIFVYEDRDAILLNLDEILYFEAMANGVYVITKNRKYNTKNTLEYFEMRLAKGFFYRCHRGYLVNIKKITRLINMIGTYNIILDGVANSIPLSKSKIKELKKRLEY